jgi:hypothetical protein
MDGSCNTHGGEEKCIQNLVRKHGVCGDYYYVMYNLTDLNFVRMSVRNKQTVCWLWGSHVSDYEEYCLLGCGTMYSHGILLMFQRNILHQSSESKSMPSKQASRGKMEAVCYLYTFINIRKYYSSYCCGNFSLPKGLLCL